MTGSNDAPRIMMQMWKRGWKSLASTDISSLGWSHWRATLPQLVFCTSQLAFRCSFVLIAWPSLAFWQANHIHRSRIAWELQKLAASFLVGRGCNAVRCVRFAASSQATFLTFIAKARPFQPARACNLGAFHLSTAFRTDWTLILYNYRETVVHVDGSWPSFNAAYWDYLQVFCYFTARCDESVLRIYAGSTKTEVAFSGCCLFSD